MIQTLVSIAVLCIHGSGTLSAEELYDLKNDPHQVVNVVGSTVMAGPQASIRRRLFDHLWKTSDPRVRWRHRGLGLLSVPRKDQHDRMECRSAVVTYRVFSPAQRDDSVFQV